MYYFRPHYTPPRYQYTDADKYREKHLMYFLFFTWLVMTVFVFYVKMMFVRDVAVYRVRDLVIDSKVCMCFQEANSLHSQHLCSLGVLS